MPDKRYSEPMCECGNWDCAGCDDPPMANQYDFTPELKEQILAEIRRRLPAIICPICHREKWTVPDGFATTPLLKNVWTNERTSGLPTIAFVCDTCGHTLFFNLGVLGFSERIAPDVKKIMDDWRAKRGY